MSAGLTSNKLTEEVLLFRDDAFYTLVEEQCGTVVLEIMKAQDISSVECLLEINNIFAFLEYDSNDLVQLKRKAGIYLNDGSYILKKGVTYKVENFLRSLRTLNQQYSNTNVHHNSFSATDVVISHDVLQKFPFIRTIITYEKLIMSSKIDLKFLNIILQSLFNNLISDERGYRYNDIIRQFAASIYILGGRTTYDFLRLNIPALLPSVQIIQSYISNSEHHLTEGVFDYNRLGNYFNSNQSTLGFCAEDCTAVVPKITYDTLSNSFLGFTCPLDANGIPITDSFSTDSFDRLESWTSTLSLSKLLNASVIQPLSSSICHISPYLLGVFGTDGKFTAADVLSRWIYIHRESKKKGVQIIGFSSDCDSRYLLAMKAALEFFAQFAFVDHPDLFSVDIPMTWSWFYMQHELLFVCMQDATHICTKLRNRLLSTKATLLFGTQLVNIDPLMYLIDKFLKFDHGLVRSDVNPKDRQNYNSAVKISNDNVLSLLEQVPNSLRIRIYLQAMKSIRLAYIEKSTNIMDRIFYGWTAVFIFRFWCLWINTMDKINLNTIFSELSDMNIQYHKNIKPKSHYFITYQSHLSMEINAHSLVYIIMLVSEQQLPAEALNIWLHNSQTCEGIFRSARSISSNFSAGVNFTVSQFISQANRLCTLQQIKNNKHLNFLRFPQHHKLSKLSDSLFTLLNTKIPAKDDIENIVQRAYEYVIQLLSPLEIEHFKPNGHQITLKDLSGNISRQLDAFWSMEVELNDDSLRDSDINTSSTTLSGFNDYDSDDLMESEEENDTIHVNNISSIQGIRVFDKVAPERKHTYFKVDINDQTKYLHKQTATWLLQKDKNSLSAERLSRVRSS